MIANQSETFGHALKHDDDLDKELQAATVEDQAAKAKKRGSAFLKMFRFDRARGIKSSSSPMNASGIESGVDESFDYANYLLQIQEAKVQIMRESQVKILSARNNKGLILDSGKV